MAKKQGGKGKTSSPSRQRSHQLARQHAEARKQARISRHCARMGISRTSLTATGGLRTDIIFPRVVSPWPMARAIFDSPIRHDVRKYPDQAVYRLTVAGLAVVEYTPDKAAAHAAATMVHNRLGFTLDRVSLLTGRATRIDARRTW